MNGNKGDTQHELEQEEQTLGIRVDSNAKKVAFVSLFSHLANESYRPLQRLCGWRKV